MKTLPNMSKIETVPVTQVIQTIHSSGQSIASWARNNNFSPRIVYMVIRGERKGLRGQTYKIAKELGMK
ncbi:MAG: hypothetical protein KA270_21435 [Saprospiraceae bacterium]|nr:hypothetical protein [Saprospiraceae bacterium]